MLIRGAACGYRSPNDTVLVVERAVVLHAHTGLSSCRSADERTDLTSPRSVSREQLMPAGGVAAVLGHPRQLVFPALLADAAQRHMRRGFVFEIAPFHRSISARRRRRRRRGRMISVGDSGGGNDLGCDLDQIEEALNVTLIRESSAGG